MKTRSIRISCLTAGLIAVALMAAKAADISVQIQPKSFPASRGGQLSVTVSGGDFDTPPIPPAPEDVTVRPYGRSQNIQIVNGRMSSSITQNFVVSAAQPGDHTSALAESGSRIRGRA